MRVFFLRNKLWATKCEVLLPRNISNTSFYGTTRLLLSDTPETLDEKTFSTYNGTLWYDYVTTSGVKTKHRIFAWHLNNTGKNLKLGVSLENTNGGRLLVQDIRVIKNMVSEEEDYLMEVGQYLAKAYLTKNALELESVSIKGVENTVLYEHKLKTGCLLGLIMEFSVDACEEARREYYVRVVAGEKATDLRDLVDSPVPKEKVHYRGSWEQADMICRTPIYHIGENKAYSISNGITDNLQRSFNSIDSLKATDNPGHYGVVYKVTIPIFNHCPEGKNIAIGINPRGGSYSGGVKIGDKVYGVPYLDTGERNYVKIMDFLAPEGESCAEFSLMHAGAASLPVAIDIRTA